LLAPLGFRHEPRLPEAFVLAATGVTPAELLVLDHDGAEAVALQAFSRLSRAGVRLAAREAGS
jgi:hypothetical protein